MLEVRFAGIEAADADARGRSRPSTPPTRSSSARRTRSSRSGRSSRCPGCATRSRRRGPAASRSRPSARSSAARRSKGPRTGCSSRSATSRRAIGRRPAVRGPRRHLRPRRGGCRRCAGDVAALGLRPVVTDTIMTRRRLAGPARGRGAGLRRVAARVTPRSDQRRRSPSSAFEGAKSRLGAVLDAEERRDLVERLLRRHRAAALATPAAWSRSSSCRRTPRCCALAEAAGARPVAPAVAGPEPGPPGGPRRRDRRPAARPARGPPGVDAAAESSTCSRPATRPASPSVVLVPDRHGRGTNALLLDPPDAIDPAFGGDSPRRPRLARRVGRHPVRRGARDVPGPRRRHARGPAARRGRSPRRRSMPTERAGSRSSRSPACPRSTRATTSSG